MPLCDIHQHHNIQAKFWYCLGMGHAATIVTIHVLEYCNVWNYVALPNVKHLQIVSQT